jgi:hypothetical protein
MNCPGQFINSLPDHKWPAGTGRRLPPIRGAGNAPAVPNRVIFTGRDSTLDHIQPTGDFLQFFRVFRTEELRPDGRGYDSSNPFSIVSR